jgi:hypothetical protein
MDDTGAVFITLPDNCQHRLPTHGVLPSRMLFKDFVDQARKPILECVALFTR